MARPKDHPAREITPPELYARRREIVKQGGLLLGAAAAWGAGLVALSGRGQADPPPEPPPVPGSWDRIERPSAYDTIEDRTAFADVTTYNNFYELGIPKAAPAMNAGSLRTEPWTVRIHGEVHEPATVDIDQLVRWMGLEERVYRMRCVEAWSMVIPWVGFPLAKLIERFRPTSRAKYVVFRTLLDPEQLPGQESDILPWPYVEGLRLDEAMNPLTLMALGLYGAPLLGQNGAPLRLVVPWKYGFKGIKSIVEIELAEREPTTTWAGAVPQAYGFYANVNPEVAHPQWSQATERRIGQIGRIPTQLYNGYAEWVAQLYRGMDLTRSY